MTMIFRSVMLVVALVTGAALFATPAQAQHHHGHDYHSLDRLASRLEAESRTLALELRHHGFGDPNLRLASREVSKISRDARHIHTILHTGASLDHLHADVLSIQQAVHHVEEHLAPYHHFAVHVQKMDALTHAIDDAIHDLEHHHVARRPVTTYRSPYGADYGRGVTFGNSNFTIRLGR